MAQTKHKVFKIKITEDGKFNLDKAVEDEINNFLSEPNNIYVGHSITVLTQDVDNYGHFKTINKFIVISLVYKDLNESEFDLKKASKKVKEVVTKEIESGKAIPEPKTNTEFDESIKELKFPLAANPVVAFNKKIEEK